MPPSPTHTLVATLGTTWSVIPEVHGIFTGLYGSRTPEGIGGLPAPERILIISTRQAWTSGEQPLRSWAEAAGTGLIPFLTSEPDLSDASGVRLMRELIFRVVLKASERPGELSCSLAGGRKTMSADMQEAARIFGCARLIHVLSDGHPGLWPEELKTPEPSLFHHPLPPAVHRWLLPVILPGSGRADFLDVSWRGRGAVQARRFPVAPFDPQARTVESAPPNTLTDEIEERRLDTGLLSNFIAEVEKDERHENWRSLYRLPPRLIHRLRSENLDNRHHALLTRLPKAELHRHLGGCLNLPAQRRVAAAVWKTLSAAEKDHAVRLARSLDWTDPAAGWRERLRAGFRPANVAAVFELFDDSTLEAALFPADWERTALKHRHPLGFAAYELPGELSGSAVLSHPAAIEPTVDALLEEAQRENLAYLELRGSPQKYRPDDPVGWLRDLAATFARQPTSSTPTVRLLWIADRRNPDLLEQIVRNAVTAADELEGFLVGIDLAGDEGTGTPEELSRFFLPAFEACLPITIHAGEGESAENIWQSAYHLHADRIGHGLSLAENPRLRDRFRDRDICLELCPTSNREVVGFRDPLFPKSAEYPRYPLLSLWNAGVPLTLCTDNPGISRCTLAEEYLTASRMVGGITLWNALAMMKQGFRKAFADTATRESILKKADQRIGQILREKYSRQ